MEGDLIILEIINKKIVKTRKSHICFGCGREFPKGTKMETSFVIDSEPWTCYLCESCQEVQKDLEPWDEYGFGDLREMTLEFERSNK